jgi:hypothetical protein
MTSVFALAMVTAACGSHHGGGDDGHETKDSGFNPIDSSSSSDDAGPGDGTGPRTFGAQSLVIPMDLSYQATGMFQAYGLVYQLLVNHIHVYWIIDPNKTYHAAACDTPGDECAWDCEVEGSGVKCAFPTASPDVTVTTSLGAHAYRGGPFVIDAADHDAALAIVNAWNDAGQMPRPVFQKVAVHEATAPFTGNVARVMVAAPTIAVFADGNEQIATGYLRAAGIPQSNGSQFPMMNCNNAATCGPGTSNPDMLTEEAIMGDLGTCDAPNNDHKNGALFDADGNPAYCQIMSMHWDVNARETVTCEGGACPQTAAQCTGQKFTFNGHEVVAEVRQFLQYGTHFFAECQAVDAFENTVPNPNYPFLDDDGRDGHFLTTTGTPPPCPCSDPDYVCSAANVCVPKQDTWKDLPGYEVAVQPSTGTVQVLRPEIPYNQFDGEYGTVGGSEPAFNLSTFLNTQYKNNRQVTLLTGPNGPGDQDLWMTGFLDGCDDVILAAGVPHDAAPCQGKISYLAGHQFDTKVPVTSGGSSQGTRLFLNALFEAQCVSTSP